MYSPGLLFYLQLGGAQEIKGIGTLFNYRVLCEFLPHISSSKVRKNFESEDGNTIIQQNPGKPLSHQQSFDSPVSKNVDSDQFSFHHCSSSRIESHLHVHLHGDGSEGRKERGGELANSPAREADAFF